MISDKYAELAEQAGFIDIRKNYTDVGHAKFIKLIDLAMAEGRQHQRESDAELCESSATIEGVAQKCAEAIRANTGELK